MKCRVVKVGGSMLLREDLPAALSRWLENQAPVPTFVIVGGGHLIDAIRELDRLRPCPPAEIHWTCVELLNVTGRMVADWLDWPCVETGEAFEQARLCGDPPQATVVLPSTFYNANASGLPVSLPNDWRTPTDSIAGLLARLVQADELVLLKACRVDPRASLGQLAAEGVIDEAMPMIEWALPVVRCEALLSTSEDSATR